MFQVKEEMGMSHGLDKKDEERYSIPPRGFHWFPGMCHMCGAWIIENGWVARNKKYCPECLALNEVIEAEKAESEKERSVGVKATSTGKRKRWGKRATVSGHELRKWASFVKARANYTCEECGAPGEHAHHIVPIDSGGDPLDLDNGVCLCVSCHRKKHPDLPDCLFEVVVIQN